MSYENYATCNLCGGPVRRRKVKWGHRLRPEDYGCARCGAVVHDPGEYGPVALMRRPAQDDTNPADFSYGGTD